ncbi:hypothetical protein LTR96_009507 [Exophiala xenobiotica]|nr:hypothetical protein LTR41_008087 [Exophiala xenobiotica]KAK5217235.1 hypothetical protein LTR72_009801 [Exophiala xenobiotica]KAK5258835.1 hypothetical protein LTR40_007113 [Exophiala xenobiotica]KAK5265140.1 hypothetical protein LTR96_009507 [Exophiala xenobiotica]KAK5287468.1 hypothetical protein LTR14_009131 [Exophiala xenobiotica]
MQPLSSSARRLVASRSIPNTIRQQFRLRSSLSRPSFALRQPPSLRLPSVPFQRYNSSLTVPEGQPETPVSDDVPSYHLSFTCKPCLHRSRHRITKQGYHYGTVLVTCPSCKARHVIADHLKVFLDQKKTLEDILREKLEEGQDLTKLLKKGTLGIRPGSLVGNEGEEDLEFWEDGAETKHKPLVGERYHAGEESDDSGSGRSRRDDDD